MSQHNHHLPPPPPSPHPSGNVPGDFYSQRRRVVPSQPPSITTDCLRVHGGSPLSPTPISGGVLTPFPFSPSTPVALNPRVPSGLNPAAYQGTQRSPNPAMEPYNPRQWSQSRQVTGSQMVFGRGSVAAPSTRAVTGMEESMPSPPPPYTPETPGTAQRVTRPTPMLDTIGFMTSPMPAELSGGNSPQMPMSPSFPPPPGQSSRHRDRSTSGLAGPRAFLSGLRGKQPAQTDPVQPSNSVHSPQFMEVKPPAARRAASTGHIQSSSAGPVTMAPGPSERCSPDNSWQPGMPLPGPPPGPPPPGARSQSLNRYPTSSSRSGSLNSDSGGETRRQRRTMAPPSLGPVPPTPAGWVEGQDVEQLVIVAPTQDHHDPSAAFQQPLRIDTGTHREASVTRRPATRDSSKQGLRERRSRSRKAKERSDDLMSPLSDESRPSGLVSKPSEGSITRRREHMRTLSGYAESNTKAHRAAFQAEAPPRAANDMLTPPYTPAIKSGDAEGSKKSIRSVSHLLHTPNEDSAIPAPLSPARPPSASSMKSSTRLESFHLQALERHRAFIEKEATATSDEERLELFATFMVHESRVRRDRYQTAYNAMAGEIVDLTRDMWRSYTPRAGKRAATPSTSMSSFDPTVPSWASDGQPTSAHGGIPSSASSFGDYTPATDAASVGDASEAFERAESRQWEAFKPTLSPIPSMAQSTAQDDSDSRGRTASRWWEQSHSGSGSGSIGNPDRIERTQRETKYMGVRTSQLQKTAEPSPAVSADTPGASTRTFGATEYPPEKVGWHESDFDTPQATPSHVVRRKSSTSSGYAALDVSRLVTLPPPYPRHHPAVNNHHPLLTDLRNEHRLLTDHSAIQKIKDGFLDQDFAIRQEQKESAKERRAKLRSNVQEKVSDGTISYAEAAQAEADFDQEEAERGKANARGNFERFETHVAQPLNTLISERITKADGCMLKIQEDLNRWNQVSDPNQAQEEGDEQPERLEQLTLLKWLFESREQLHKEMFDLHAERSEQYSEVILTPYRIQRLQAKIDEAVAFFSKDRRQRQLAFARDSLKRYEVLQHDMEQNVSRGVEDQLSAFWDIAPNLMEVIQRVPSVDQDSPGGFNIDIPISEYEENPSYAQFPLQYLYSVLSHAGKSTYQFIESQTNLLCLLHEVRTANTMSGLRLVQIEGSSKSPRTPGSPSLQSEIGQAGREAEARLTEDLKEKVGEVESQWREALGDGLENCKSRVRAFLEESGGWEDGLED